MGTVQKTNKPDKGVKPIFDGKLDLKRFPGATLEKPPAATPAPTSSAATLGVSYWAALRAWKATTTQDDRDIAYAELLRCHAAEVALGADLPRCPMPDGGGIAPLMVIDVATDTVNILKSEAKRLADEFNAATCTGEPERQAKAYGEFQAKLEQLKAAIKIQTEIAKYAAEQTDIADVPPVDWAVCIGEPPAREWPIQDWLGFTPTGLWGAGGFGKTKLLQAMATGLAVQKPYLAAAYSRPLVVVAWLCEDDEAEVWRTQAAINRYFGVSMAELVKAGRLHIVPRAGRDNMLFAASARGEASFTPVFDRLREKLNDLKADVFIGDNIAHLYGGVENDRHQVTRYVNGVAGLVHDRPFAAIHVGHVAKSEGSEFSGSTAWENAIRSRWLLARSLTGENDAPAVPDTVYLARRKANHAGLGYQRFKFDKGVFVPEQMQTAAPGDIRARNDAADEALLATFDKLRAAGLCPTDTPNSGDYLPKRAQEMGFAPGYTVAQLKETMNRLIRDGKLKRHAEAGTYANRSPRAGLVRVLSTK